MRHPVASLAVLLLLPAAASAEPPPQPPLMPSRDVRIVYDVQPEGAPQPTRIVVSFSRQGRLMRIDGPDGEGTTIFDRDRRVLTVVMNAAHAYMEAPQRQKLRSPFLFDPATRFVRLGTDSVTGIPCTRWQVSDNGGSAMACIADDGVVLSESGTDSQGARGKLTAVQVSYAPVAASMFKPPPGYDRITHPEGPAAYERRGASMGGGAVTGPSQP